MQVQFHLGEELRQAARTRYHDSHISFDYAENSLIKHEVTNRKAREYL